MSDWDGKTVTIKTGTFAGKQFVVEGWAVDVMRDVLNAPPSIEFNERAERDGIRDGYLAGLCYGKINGTGHLVHESEFA
jgi:hypothetical protein